MDSRFVKYLETLERKTDNIPGDCYRCAYRDKDVNMCWYTVTTHKTRGCDRTCKCSHFVPETVIQLSEVGKDK